MPNISGVKEKKFERKRIMARKTVTLLPDTQHALDEKGKKQFEKHNLKKRERATKKIDNGGTNDGTNTHL